MNEALYEARCVGHSEVVKWLLAHGTTGVDALNHAITSGQAGIAKMLVQHFGSGAWCLETAVHIAASNNQFEILQWLHELELDAMDSRVVMCVAVRYGHLEIIE